MRSSTSGGRLSSQGRSVGAMAFLVGLVLAILAVIAPPTASANHTSAVLLTQEYAGEPSEGGICASGRGRWIKFPTGGASKDHDTTKTANDTGGDTNYTIDYIEYQGAIRVLALKDGSTPVAFDQAIVYPGGSIGYVYSASPAVTMMPNFVKTPQGDTEITQVIMCALVTKKLTVTKDVVPDGDPTTFQFTVECGTVKTNGDLTVKESFTFKLGDNGSTATAQITSAGVTYTGPLYVTTGYTCRVTEAADSAYTTTPALIQTVLVAGDSTMSFTNTKKVVKPAITVAKSPSPSTVAEPGGNVTFTVTVTNTAASPADLTSLVDDIYGNLDGQGTCDVTPAVQLAASVGTYSCSFTKLVSGQPLAGNTAEHKDTVTATATNTAGTVTATGTATVDITNVAASMVIEKTANPTTLPEPGGSVTYTITVKNTSTVDAITVGSISDNKFPGAVCAPAIGTIPAGQSASCTFTGQLTAQVAGSTHTNTATVGAASDDGEPLTGTDTADVAITSAAPAIAVTKDATTLTVAEPSGVASYTVKVTNTSPSSATVTALNDDRFGNLATTCGLPWTLASGASKTCTFTKTVSGVPGYEHKNIVTATANNAAGTVVTASDDAVVTVTDLPSSISVAKTARTLSVNEPGATVTYDIVVKNTSAVDTVTIKTVLDDSYPVTCLPALPVDLKPGETLACTASGFVGANAGDKHTNKVTVGGTDDDGVAVAGSDTETVTVLDVPSSILVTKTALTPTVPQTGGTVSYQVTVKNTSTADAVTISKDSFKDNKFSDLSSLTCTGGLPATLAPNDTLTCTFDGVLPAASAGDEHANIATVTGLDDDGGTAVDDSDAAIVEYADVANVTLAKNGPATALPGDKITYSLIVTNQGPGASFNTVVTDAIPAGLVLDLASIRLNSSPTSACGLLAGGILKCSLGTMTAPSPGSPSIAAITYAVTVPPLATVKAQYINSAAVSTTTPGDDQTDNGATHTLVIPVGDVMIEKRVASAVTQPGGQVTYTLIVKNNGPNTAQNTTVEDKMPVGLTIVGSSVAPSAGHSCTVTTDKRTLNCALGPMTANETVLITIVAKVDANAPPQTLVNVGAVTASNDGDPSNNTDSAEVRIDAVPVPDTADIAVTKVADGPGGTVGKPLSYTITIKNNGTAATTASAKLAQVIDALPSSVTFVSAEPSRGTCVLGSALTCEIGTLKPGESATIKVTVIPNVAGSITNVAVGMSSAPDSNLGNNTGTATVPVAPGSTDIRLVKTSNKKIVAAGGKVTYTLSVTNTGTQTAVNVVICDRLPAALSFISIPRNARFRNGQACWKLGDLAPGASRQIGFTVRVSTAVFGKVKNVAVATAANAPTRTSARTVRVKKKVLAVRSGVTG